MKTNAATIKKAVTAVFFALLAVYLIYHGLHALRKTATLVPAAPDTVFETVTLDGAFFEEKTLATAEKRGVAVLHFEIGEKVAKDAVLTDIYPEKERKTAERLNAILHRIRVLKDDVRLVPSTDKALRETYAAALAPLEKERDSLLAALGTPLETVYAAVSGYAYPANGYETIFPASEVEALDIKSYEKRINAAPENGKTPAFALLTDHRRTFVAKVTKAQAEAFALGTVYPSSDSRIVSLTLSEKRGEDSVLLIFAIDAGLARYEGGKATLSLVGKEYRGLRIPEKALRKKDGKTFVFVFSEGVARIREVDVLIKKDGFVLVSDTYESPSGSEVLKENDLVFAASRGLYDGKLID